MIMEEKAKEIQVVPFMASSRSHNKAVNMKPILVKVGIMIFMITVAMLLISSGNMFGYVIYGKEVLEFIVFVLYMVKKKRREG